MTKAQDKMLTWGREKAIPKRKIWDIFMEMAFDLGLKGQQEEKKVGGGHSGYMMEPTAGIWDSTGVVGDVGDEMGRINRGRKGKGVECYVGMFSFVLEVVRECG